MSDPVVLVADDELNALTRLAAMINPQLYVIAVRTGGLIFRYAARFHAAVFISADTVPHGQRSCEGWRPVLLNRLDAQVITVGKE